LNETLNEKNANEKYIPEITNSESNLEIQKEEILKKKTMLKKRSKKNSLKLV